MKNKVYILVEDRLKEAKLIKHLNKTTSLVFFNGKRIEKDKSQIAERDELVCIVFEKWDKENPGFRLEKRKHLIHRVPAHKLFENPQIAHLIEITKPRDVDYRKRN